MSEYTQCNFCKLRAMKSDAKKKGYRVVVVPVNPLKDMYNMGGVDVYVLKDPSRKIPLKMDWVCWFMQITGVCVC